MDCQTHQEEIGRYLDGELTSPVAASLEAHLSACGACREALNQQKLDDQWFRSTVRHAAPDPQRVIALQARIVGRQPQPSQARLRWLSVALLLVLLGGAWYRKGPLPVYAAAIADHADHGCTVVSHVPFVQADALQELARTFTGSATAIPDLSQRGYCRVQGRLCGLRHRHVLHLVYIPNDRLRPLLSVFIEPRDQEHALDRAMPSWAATAAQNGYHLVSRQAAQFSIFLVSTEPADVLQQDAAGVTRQF